MAQSSDYYTHSKDIIEALFSSHPQMYKGYNILAGKALLLALSDRRTARRLHVMGNSMRSSGHKNWGGTKK